MPRRADEIENHLDEVVMRATPLLTRRLWVLDTAVTIAPLLGLFGTIIGLIQTFNVLSAHGGPAEVTGGIADALIATGAGVLIAIIAVCWLNCLNALLAVHHVPDRDGQARADQPPAWQRPRCRGQRRSRPRRRRLVSPRYSFRPAIADQMARRAPRSACRSVRRGSRSFR